MARNHPQNGSNKKIICETSRLERRGKLLRFSSLFLLFAFLFFTFCFSVFYFLLFCFLLFAFLLFAFLLFTFLLFTFLLSALLFSVLFSENRLPRHTSSSSTEYPIVPSGIFTPKLSATVAPITAKVSPAGSFPFPFIEGE